MICGQELPLDHDWVDSFHSAYTELGGLGERVLGRSNPTTSPLGLTAPDTTIRSLMMMTVMVVDANQLHGRCCCFFPL